MVLLTTSEEWQRQSSLLLQARPTTTRISTKYNIPNLESSRYQRPKKRKREADTEEKDASTAPSIPRAVLTLKTYDPESGVCLQFKTGRAADVSRLVVGLGRLGRHMAALPQQTEDTVMEDAPAAADGTIQEPLPTAATAAVEGKGQQHSSGSGPGKKKKKGKK